MSGTSWLARHGRTLLLIAAVLAVGGLISAFSLPLTLFPQVAFPRVVVDLDAGDRTAAQTALLLTRPLEEVIRAVPGVVSVRSETSRGTAQISIDFGWGRDMTASTLLVDAAIGKALPSLPTGASYDVRRMDPTVFPIIAYALQSDSVSPVALRDLASYQLVPLLAAVPGLSRVDVQGGQSAEIEVEADPQVLALHDLGLADLVTAVSGANVLHAVGRAQDHHKLYLVLANHSVNDLASLRQLVLRSGPGGMLRLGDVATVRDGYVPQWIKVSEDGRPAVLLNVYQQPDGNAVQIARDVHQRLAGFALPAGVNLHKWYDQSELVTASAGSVRDAMLIGLLLAALVIWIFLRSVRVTLLALVVVPAILAIAVLLLHLLGMSFNIMTLGGMAAAVGLVIDDVIVMIEHIARRAGHASLPDSAAQGASAVLPAAREYLAPLSGSSLATLIVFIPLGFLDGVTGAFSKALSITMVCALVVSWMMTAWVVPLLAQRWIDFGRWRDPGSRPDGRFRRSHAALYDGLSRRRSLLPLLLLPVLLLGALAYTKVATGFMPAVDESGFVMDYYTAPGTSLDESSRIMAQVDTILQHTPEVETFSRRLGSGLGGDLGQSYHGDYFVRLKSGHQRSTDTVMNAVRQQVAQQVPGITVELAQLMEDLIGDLTAVPQPIEIKLYGVDSAALDRQAQKVAAAIASIPGVVDIKDGVKLAGDAVDIHIDANQAAIEGITADALSQSVNQALDGVVATQLPQLSKTVGVRVRASHALTINLSQLAAMPIRAADGHVFPLGRVAQLQTVTGEAQISREDLQPMVAVTARIEGRGIRAGIADVKTLLARPGMLAAGIRYQLGGLYAQQQIAFVGLGKVFAAALVAEFILLLVLYRQLDLALIVLGCALFSSSAVFIALWCCGVDLNITAMMGMTMVIGIGTEMAIFYISEYLALAEHLPWPQALRQASVDRLRPITMTTLTAMLTLLPLALALGQGAGIQQPLAIAILGGLCLQYPMVLLIMPLLIGWLRQWRQRG